MKVDSEQLLFECLRVVTTSGLEVEASARERLAALSNDEWMALIALADEQKVGANLCHCLSSSTLAPVVPDPIAGADVRVLAPEDLLLHLCSRQGSRGRALSGRASDRGCRMR